MLNYTDFADVRSVTNFRKQKLSQENVIYYLISEITMHLSCVFVHLPMHT